MKLMERFRQDPREREIREREMREREMRERDLRERETQVPEASDRAALSTADLAGAGKHPEHAAAESAAARAMAERAAAGRSDARPDHGSHVDVQWNPPRRAPEPAGRLSDADVEDAVVVAQREQRAAEARLARDTPRAETRDAVQPRAARTPTRTDTEPHAQSHAGHVQRADDGVQADRVQAGRAPARARQMPPADGQRLAPLFNTEAAQGFRSRWDATQIGFVDDPRQAVQQADELVTEVMKSLAQSFADERARLEAQMHDERASTENLRVALQRYRSFFQRLLAL